MASHQGDGVGEIAYFQTITADVQCLRDGYTATSLPGQAIDHASLLLL